MRVHAALAYGIADAMLHVILNQRALRVVDHAFNGLKLLRQIEAGAPAIEHGEDGRKLTVGLFQPFDDFRVRGMLHDGNPTP